jgi:hypothetical protein
MQEFPRENGCNRFNVSKFTHKRGKKADSGVSVHKRNELPYSQKTGEVEENRASPAIDGKTGAGAVDDRFKLECLAMARLKLGEISNVHDLSGLSPAQLERGESLCEIGLEFGLTPEQESELTALLATGAKQASNQADLGQDAADTGPGDVRQAQPVKRQAKTGESRTLPPF